MIKSFNTPAMQARRAQAGITLIEVSIGLIIAAIIAAAAFIAFQNNSRRSEVRENTQVLTEIFSELKQKFGRTGGYENLTLAAAIGSAVIPPSLATGNASAVNSYAGTIDIVQPTVGSVDLLWGSVPPAQCLDLVVALQDGAEGIDVGGTSAKNPAVLDADGAVVTPATEFNLAGATAACQVDDPVDITFTIARN